MSPAELQREAGLKRLADVYELERIEEKPHRPRIDRVVRVARALRVSIDWLAGAGSDDVPAPVEPSAIEAPKPEAAA